MRRTPAPDRLRPEAAGEAQGAPDAAPRPLFARRTRTSTVLAWTIALAPWLALAIGLLAGR